APSSTPRPRNFLDLLWSNRGDCFLTASANKRRAQLQYRAKQILFSMGCSRRRQLTAQHCLLEVWARALAATHGPARQGGPARPTSSRRILCSASRRLFFPSLGIAPRRFRAALLESYLS